MKQKILDGYSQMREDIAIAKDDCLKDIWLYIRDYMEETPKDFFLNHVKEMILASLEDTYSITSAAARKLYDIKSERLQDGEIERLMYSAVGKDLYDRLEEHYDKAIQREDATNYFRNRVILIVDTETLTVSNAVLHSKVNRRAKFCEIFHPEDECCDGECEYWITKGKMPIEELSELPPFHPDCECEVIYYFE